MADEEDDKRTSNPAATSSKTTSSSAAGSWGSWGSWGQGWIDTVKEKSAQTMQMVKKDLNEFVDVIQGDTSVVISETADKIEDSTEIENEEEGLGLGDDSYKSIESATTVVKKGMANFLHSVSEFMAIPPDDSDEIITVTDFPSSSNSQYDRRKEKLCAIQVDPGTYCNEPEGLFNDWLEVFNLDENKLDMSNMLVQNPSIRAIYTQLVPAVVSHTTFWQRYYYQVFLLDAEEKKRQEIVARASNDVNDSESESGWGDDDDDDDGIEVLSSSNSFKTTSVMDYSIITSENDNKNDDTETTVVDSPTEFVKTNSVLLEKPPMNSETTETESPATTVIDDEPNIDNITTTTTEQPSVNNVPESQQNEHEVEVLKKTETDCGQMLEISSDVIDISCNVETESDSETIQGNIEEVNQQVPIAACAQGPIINEKSETSSLSSWMSIDDVIKVKKIAGEQVAKSDTNGASANESSDSNGILVNKSDIIESDEDFDLDIEDDVNEEEVAKMVEEIKNMSHGGTIDDDDDDWENWE